MRQEQQQTAQHRIQRRQEMIAQRKKTLVRVKERKLRRGKQGFQDVITRQSSAKEDMQHKQTVELKNLEEVPVLLCAACDDPRRKMQNGLADHENERC